MSQSQSAIKNHLNIKAKMPTNALEKKFNVLIVDDDKFVLLILNRILQKIGCCVSSLEKGHEALQSLETENYDAAIIDVRLQDMNGLDLLEMIHKKAPCMKKIILTGYPSDEDKVKAIKRGADYYLAKPIPSEKLIEIIERTRK